MMDREPDMDALATYHFGHLPVWIDSNAYLSGATVSKHDQHAFTWDPDTKVCVKLVQEDGIVRLDSNLWSLLKETSTGLISTDTLGQAFEPEQRFENPDGSDILFDRDYFGDHRGLSTIPGPFADPDMAGRTLWG